jgi:hypothetical protein
MGARLRNSMELVKASGRVLLADRELLLFPLLSGVASVLVAITFFVPTFLVGGFEAAAEAAGTVGLVGIVLFYIVQFTVIFFFNSALVGAALIRLEGGDPTVVDGLRIAGERFGAILGYAVIAATVGVILNMISQKASFLGRMVVGFVGLSWNLATYLTVPVLVARDVGPVDAVKESARLLRRTWGEQVAGTVGMGAAFFLGGASLGLVSAGLLTGVGMAAPALVPPLLVTLVLVWVLFALTASALKGIYAAALFRFADTGEAGWGFDGTSLADAFSPEGR